jgi:hypothetical protein
VVTADGLAPEVIERTSTRMRRPSLAEIIIQSILVLFLMLAGIEYFRSFFVDCTLPGPKDAMCHLWGGEGSSDEHWNYRNRDIYLRSVMAMMGANALAIAIPFLMPRPWLGLVGMIATLIAAGVLLPWIFG